MDTFSTNGLPPLDGDERGQEQRSRRRSGVCHTVDCGRPSALGMSYCTRCIVKRLEAKIREGDSALETWPRREDTTCELPAVKPPAQPAAPAALGSWDGLAAQAEDLELSRFLAAPFFAVEALDYRCCWCRRIKTELGLPLSAKDAEVAATIKAAAWAGNGLLARWECAAHRERRMAHADLCDAITDLMARQGKTSAQIAAYYRHGYLGGRLHDDDLME